MKKKIITTGIALFLALGIYAQPNNPNNPVPLDGGLSLLLAAGAAYGAKKLHDKVKND